MVSIGGCMFNFFQHRQRPVAQWLWHSLWSQLLFWSTNSLEGPFFFSVCFFPLHECVFGFVLPVFFSCVPFFFSFLAWQNLWKAKQLTSRHLQSNHIKSKNTLTWRHQASSKFNLWKCVVSCCSYGKPGLLGFWKLRWSGLESCTATTHFRQDQGKSNLTPPQI